MATKRQLKEYDSVVLRPEDIGGKVGFFDVFGRKNAVHIEIGSGRGTFLVNQAAVFPQINFLGVEWANRYYKYAVDRIGRKALENVRIIRTEAASFIAGHIGSGTVECFHIYFPDPWPKKRHHKRRFICKENVAQLIRCLKKNGLINITTDHADYFKWMQQVFEDFTNELRPVEFVRPAGANENELAGTNYERKYLKQKKAIYTLTFRRR
jgi:tRNA (guanine-N7-)-methyltransferase